MSKKIYGIPVSTPINPAKVIPEVPNEKIDSAVAAYMEENPITPSSIGARPDTWTPTAEEVGARPSSWTPTAEEVGARPNDWMPTAEEVGARPNDWMPTAEEVGAATTKYVDDRILVAQDLANSGDVRLYLGSSGFVPGEGGNESNPPMGGVEQLPSAEEVGF